MFTTPMRLRMQINNFIEDWRIQQEISGIVQTITLYPVQMTMWMLMQRTSCDQQSVPAVSLCTCSVLIKQQPLGTQKVSSNSHFALRSRAELQPLLRRNQHHLPLEDTPANPGVLTISHTKLQAHCAACELVLCLCLCTPHI